MTLVVPISPTVMAEMLFDRRVCPRATRQDGSLIVEMGNALAAYGIHHGSAPTDLTAVRAALDCLIRGDNPLNGRAA